MSELLARAGIEEFPKHWKLLNASHKGLYSLNFRLRAAADIHSRPNALLYARDVKEASFVAGLRNLPVLGGKNSRFIFEMHEALFLQHRDLENRRDWRKTLELERSILRKADGLVVTNRDIADIAAAELGYTGPVVEEPNGINERIFHALELFTDQVPWPGENDAVNLVYVGNMQHGKGVQ